MRLTNEIRDKVLDKLVEKAFPKAEIDKLTEDTANLFSKNEKMIKRKRIYEEYPMYISCDEYVRIVMRDGNKTKSYLVHLPFKYAILKDRRYESLTFDLDDNELDQDLRDSSIKLIDAVYSRDDFRSKTKSILYSVFSSTKLLELIPEAEEYLPREEVKTVVNMSNVDFIRNCLRRRGGGVEDETD